MLQQYPPAVPSVMFGFDYGPFVLGSAMIATRRPNLKIALIGVTGRVESWLATELLARGYTVSGIVLPGPA
ncbi:MAG: hypothetical protein ACRELF_06565 [Gemmataceae bacterium]